MKKVEAMMNQKDRYLTDTLRRSEAINFLVRCDFDRAKVEALTDDVLTYVYDVAKRKGKCAICDRHISEVRK